MPLNNPIISVIIPAFNAESSLEATLRSVKAQSRPVDEIIIGDDSSTDRTVEIGKSMGVTVLELPKGNGSIARNRAFDCCKGEVIFLLDADDIWAPNKVEVHLSNWIQHPDAGFLIDPSTRVRANGDRRGLNGDGPAGKLAPADMVLNKNWSCGSAISVRREIWMKINGFNESLPGLQDIDFLVRSAEEAGYGWRISQSLTDYNLHATSVSRSVPWNAEFISKVRESMACLTDKEFGELVKAIKVRNAAKAGFPAGLYDLFTSKVMPWDQRFVKAIYFGIEQTLNSRRAKQ